MKISRLTIRIVMVLSLTAPLAFANPIDPRIVVAGDTGSTPIPGLTFDFTINANGGGFFPFANASGINWFNLSLTTKTPDGATNEGAYDVESDLFLEHRVSFSSDFSTVTILFYGTNSNFPGIPFDPNWSSTDEEQENDLPFGSHFYISLNNSDQAFNDTNGFGGWVAGEKFFGAANVPEPGAFTLLLSGILALGVPLARRKRPGRRSNRIAAD
jgi:hypothetical protein